MRSAGASAAAVTAAAAAAAVPLAAGVENEDDDDDQDPDVAVVKKIAKAVHFDHRRFRLAKASFFFSFGRLAPLLTEYASASGSVKKGQIKKGEKAFGFFALRESIGYIGYPSVKE